MKRSALWTLIVVVVALIFVGLVVALGGRTDENKPVETSETKPSEDTNTQQDLPKQPGSIDQNSTNTQSGAAVVTITNFTFDPKNLTVKKGTTVTWKNNDTVSHTVTPDNDDVTEEFRGSDSLGNGATYSVTFNTLGTYSYHCTPHPEMKATVRVIE